jgi:hypothetical protein
MYTTNVDKVPLINASHIPPEEIELRSRPDPDPPLTFLHGSADPDLFQNVMDSQNTENTVANHYQSLTGKIIAMQWRLIIIEWCRSQRTYLHT